MARGGALKIYHSVMTGGALSGTAVQCAEEGDDDTLTLRASCRSCRIRGCHSQTQHEALEPAGPPPPRAPPTLSFVIHR